LTAFATISRQQHGRELAVLLHRGEHVRQAQAHLRDFVAHLIAGAAADGDVRTDISPTELAGFCLHALTAAEATSSTQAVNRLVKLTLAGLRP
jgi:hypothetical protein